MTTPTGKFAPIPAMLRAYADRDQLVICLAYADCMAMLERRSEHSAWIAAYRRRREEWLAAAVGIASR